MNQDARTDPLEQHMYFTIFFSAGGKVWYSGGKHMNYLEVRRPELDSYSTTSKEEFPQLSNIDNYMATFIYCMEVIR